MKQLKFGIFALIGILAACNSKTENKEKFVENSTESVENKIEITNSFSTIEVAQQNESIKILLGNDVDLKNKTIETIRTNPNNYNPPVLYALSRTLFQQNEKDEASYWFYVGQLRARYDANLCTDESAKQAVQVLNNEYGSEINAYAFQDITKLEQTVTKAVDFVKKNPENYDHRWINLHGMEAINAGLNKTEATKEMSKPKTEWETIKSQTINDYYNGFMTYVKDQK